MKILPKRSLLSSVVLACLSTSALALDDFNIPFINASELGNVYTGWAASAYDASTSFSNPAGLVKLQNQQLVVSAIGLSGSSRFTGTQMTPPFPFPPFGPQSGSASTKLRGFVPSFYYAIPLRENLVLAFGQTIPWALGTNYPKDSVVRYAATRTQIVVLDFGPSVGYKIDNKWSVGLGFDINRMMFKINNMIGPPLSIPDSESQNGLYGRGYGYHAGVLYQPIPCTRVGLSFNSMTTFHTSGNSTIYQPFPPGAIRINTQETNAALPARTQLSVFHNASQQIDVMGTIYYTNWRTLHQITMKQTVAPGGIVMPVTIPLNYHNTFDYGVGLNYKPWDKWIFRTGLIYLNTPSNNLNRNVSDPISRAVIFGLGAHYQQNRCLGYDVGYAHSFFSNSQYNLATPLTTLNGSSTQNANVLGGQVTWDI